MSTDNAQSAAAPNTVLRAHLNAALDAADQAGYAMHHIQADYFPGSETSPVSVSLLTFANDSRRHYAGRSVAEQVCAAAGIPHPDVLFTHVAGRPFQVLGDPDERFRVYCAFDPAQQLTATGGAA